MQGLRLFATWPDDERIAAFQAHDTLAGIASATIGRAMKSWGVLAQPPRLPT